MSKQVDERIVSMQFDNKNFEQNVSTTMSTLDKFKQKLNLSGASKGLEEVNTAAKKVDMNSLGNGIETVRTKFSAMEVIGVTALANITNSAVNAGKKIVSALTIDPVKSGFQEYETQINAVQTILANTESKGSTIDDVNAALRELNEYADKTIYNFTEMTRNIGTFTAAGVDLSTATNAIQGIANLAAVSGSTSQQASTAMYQLSQAMASGTVKLMDWNSVVNAGMGGQVFQDALKETARVRGVAIDKMIDDEGSFRETLKSGWLTTEILTETLQKFTLATEGLTDEQIKANREMLKAKGYTEAQIDEIFELGNTATDAATKVKTFTQLWDVLKEAAQSGWTQTWQLIIGDFKEAKNLLSPLADFLTNIINKTSKWRNDIISSAFGESFKNLKRRLDELFGPVTKVTDAVKGMTDSLVDYDKLVDEIIAGKWKNAPTRWQDLAAAGYDWAHAQNLVNERLGCSVRHATNYTESVKQQSATTQELTESQAEQLAELVKLTDEQLRAKGYTDDQIAALRELQRVAKKIGLSVEELLANIDNIDGRWLFLESFKNIGLAIVGVCKAIGSAFQDVFNIKQSNVAHTLFNIIAALHRFSRMIMLTDKETGEFNETGENIRRTLRGVFAVFHILLNIIGGPIKLAFKLLVKVLEALDIPILSVTASIGDMLYEFDKWLFENNIIVKAITKCITVIKKWVKEFLAIPQVQNGIAKIKQKFVDLWEYLKKTFSGGKSFLSGLVDQVKSGELRIGQAIHIVLKKIGSFGKNFFTKAVDIGKNIVLGLKQGVTDESSSVRKTIEGFANNIITFVKDVLGIHSPSTEFIEIGKNIIAGLLVGIGSIKILSVVSSIVDLIGSLSGPLEGIGEVLIGTGKVLRKSAGGIRRILNSTAKVIKGFAKTLSSVGNLINAKALQTVAIAIAILAASVAVLAMMDPARVWSAVGVIVVLAGVLGGLMIAINKLGMSGPGGIKEAISGVKMFGTLATALITISASLLLLAISLRIIGGMEWKELGVAAAGIVLLGLVLSGLMFMTKFSGKTLYLVNQTITSFAKAMLLMSIALRVIGGMEWKELGVAASGMVLLGLVMAGLIWSTKLAGPFAGTIGKTLLNVAGAMAILAIVAKIIAGMEWSEMAKAAVGITFLSGIMVGLIAAVKLAGKNPAAIGKTLLAISTSILMLTIVAKIISGMSWGGIAKAAVGLAGLVLIIRMMVQAVKLAGPNPAKIGATLLAIAGAMTLLTITAKIISGMSWGDMAKAAIGLVALVAIIRMMVQAVKLAGPNPAKIGATMLAMAASVGILAGIAVLLSLVEIGALAKGIIAVGLLGGVMALMIVAAKGAQDCMKNLIVMTVAIGVMAAAVIILSHIDPKKLAGATAALTIVMGMFALMISATKSAKKAASSLTIMVIVVGALALIISLLARMPAESVIGSAIALSILMVALTGAMVLLSLVGNKAGKAIMGATALLAMAVPLLAFVGILALMQNVKTSMGAVTSLIALVTAMTLLLIPLTLVGLLGMTGAPYLGVLALLTMAVPLLAFVGILALMQKIDGAASNALILAFLITTITAALVAVARVGPLAAIAIPAIAGLTAVLIGLGAVTALIGAFVKDTAIIEAGMKVLEVIANGLGSIIGNFVSGFMTGVMSGLPEIGLLLSQFMVNATPFVMGAKQIDASMLDGVKALVDIILTLTKANILDGLTSWFTGGSSLTKFGEDIAAFGPSMKTFADSVAGIDAPATEAAAKAAKALAEMTEAIPNEGGVVGWFAGENSIAKYAESLSSLATALVTFSTESAGINVESVKAAAEAGKAICEMTKSIPNEGGVVAWFAGENSISKFAADLPLLANALLMFSTSSAGINIESVNAAVEAGKGICEMTKSIPNDDGVIGWFAGNNSISKFAADLPLLANGLFMFSNSAAGINIDNVKAAVEAGKGICEMTKAIPDSGGIKSWFSGEQSISKFSSELGNLGTALSDFATNAGGAKTGDVTRAVNATKSIVDLLSVDIGGKAEAMGKFGSNLSTFGGNLSSFYSKVSSIGKDKITSAIDGVKKIIATAGTIKKDTADTFKKFGEALKKAGEDGVCEFIKALNSKTAKKDAKTELSSFVTSAADSIKTDGNKQKFKSVGSYLMDGLASGIRNNKSKATKAAQEVADAVEEIIRSAWKVNSPSKLFYRIALGVGEGITYALSDSTSDVKNSARDLADNTAKGFGNAISQIYDFVNSDMDTNPTIRPVLDLSDVRSGANSIASMFSGNRTLAISAPGVGAISASMANRQNGNGDLTSAINKLAKSNSNRSGNTYNINGITYSEGSDVSDAIRVLVRAANMEGRT